MDYFKHYATASDAKRLNLVFDKYGHRGIAFWWMLLELCVHNWDGLGEPEFQFHQRTVVTKLKSTLNSVQPWLEFCSDIGLCAFAQNETQMLINVPKLKEIKETRGRIKSNKPEKNRYIKNKIKNKNNIYSDDDSLSENPIQDSTSNLAEVIQKSELTPDQLVDLFNEILGGRAGKIKQCFGLSGSHIQELLTTLSFAKFQKKETWIEVFTAVSKSEFLRGEVQKATFTATLSWIVKHENALDILNGKYPAAATPENQFSSMRLE